MNLIIFTLTSLLSLTLVISFEKLAMNSIRKANRNTSRVLRELQRTTKSKKSYAKNKVFKHIKSIDYK